MQGLSLCAKVCDSPEHGSTQKSNAFCSCALLSANPEPAALTNSFPGHALNSLSLKLCKERRVQRGQPRKERLSQTLAFDAESCNAHFLVSHAIQPIRQIVSSSWA